jgi:inositol oxygenase
MGIYFNTYSLQIIAFYDEPQWSVVGDTFPVGCAPRDSIVFGEKSFANNKDLKHPVYRYEDRIITEKTR